MAIVFNKKRWRFKWKNREIRALLTTLFEKKLVAEHLIRPDALRELRRMVSVDCLSSSFVSCSLIE